MQSNQSTLSLPNLNLSPKTNHKANANNQFSFELNPFEQDNDNEDDDDDNERDIIDILRGYAGTSKLQKLKNQKKRRGMGPICSACNKQMNPCHAHIQCTECMEEDVLL